MTYGIGHNNPPEPLISVEELQNNIREANLELLERADECLNKAQMTPDICETDELESTITDRVGIMQKAIKALDATRTAVKEPYLTRERAVDGFFNPKIELLKKAKMRLERIGGAYQSKKAEEARRKQREEEQRLQRQRDEDAKKAAEAERIANEASRVADEAESKGLNDLAEISRQNAANAQKIANTHLDNAVVADNAANKAGALAMAKPSQLTSSTGQYGSRGSLRRTWKGEIVNRVELDLNALREHISTEHLQVAVNRWVAANIKDNQENPTLKGVRIYQDDRLQVRA